MENFRFWCQKVLPLVYDDSLSYYELLCKVVKYINDLIQNLKNLGQDIDDINTRIDELWNYIQNLDLQTEVNNRIDQMVEDGSFQRLIEEAIAKIYTLETGNYENSKLVKQMMYSIGMSYYMDAWATRNPKLSYGNIEDNDLGNGTALDADAKAYTKLDCSTFVILCMLGIPYADSPYNGRNIRSRGAMGFCRQWIPTIHNDTLQIRWTYELLMYANYNKLLYDYVNPSQIQTGDLVFWCWNQEFIDQQPADWWGHGTYEYAAHVAMCVTNCAKFQSTVGIVHANSSSALMSFQDIEDYTKSLTTQHMYPKIMRPRLNMMDVYLNGLWRFRGDIDAIPLVLNASAINYAGGKMPSNMNTYVVNKSDGSVSTDLSRWTSYYIPYNISMFVTNNVSTVGYNLCYYTEDKTYLSYSQNKFTETPNAKYVRLEYFNRNSGDLTPEQKNSIQSMNLLTYHTWCDPEQSFLNQTDNDIKYLDTVFNFEKATIAKSQNILNGM